MIQRYVHVGQLSDSYMALVYFSHLKPHFVRRGDLNWGSMAPLAQVILSLVKIM